MCCASSSAWWTLGASPRHGRYNALRVFCASANCWAANWREVWVFAEAYGKAAAIKRLFKLFLQRSWDKLEAATAEDAFVYVQAPTDIPFAGKYTGKDCVRRFVEALNKSFQIAAVPEVFYYLNESGSVFVACDVELEAGGTVVLKTSVLSKVKVNEQNDLVKVAIIFDTLAAQQALQGVRQAKV